MAGCAKVIRLRQASFERELAKIDKRLVALLNAHDDWQALARRLRTVPGVGPVVSQTLIALLPELGQLSRRMIASLVGLAPYDDDSGKRRGERHIKGGRATVRQALYMAAVVAKKRNPMIAAFAQAARQVAQGHHYRLHAQVTGDPQRDAARWHRLERLPPPEPGPPIPWFVWTTTIPPSRPCLPAGCRAQEAGQ